MLLCQTMTANFFLTFYLEGRFSQLKGFSPEVKPSAILKDMLQ